jgi:hypothetical protein
MSDNHNESATQAIQRERLSDIVEARRHCREQFRRAREASLTNQLSDQGSRILALHAVREYALELETLMEPPGDSESAAGTDYWNEKEIGQIPLPDSNELGKESIRVSGVSQLVNRDWPLHIKYGSETQDPVHGKSVQAEQTAVYPPLSVSERAFRACNSFCAEVGLDVHLQDGAPNAEFDYSDILDEGPPEGEA